MVTQQSIAEKLNVSIGTVSRSLRNDLSVAPETRSRVLELAAELGYRPSRRYRPKGASSRKTRQTVGVLMRYDGDNILQGHQGILAGISEMAGAMGWGVMVHHVTAESATGLLDAPPPMLEGNCVNGLILVNHFPPAAAEAIAKRWPCVSVNHKYLDFPGDIVEFDSYQGLGKVVRRLHHLGHRRMGFVCDARGYSWSHARHAGFMQALNMLGLTYRPQDVLVTPADGDLDVLAEQVRPLVDRGVTALASANDTSARTLLKALDRAGLVVPEDLSVVGFGHDASLRSIPLTTIHTSFEEAGAAAVRQLEHRLQHPQAPRGHVLLAGEFVEGKTTAAPKRAAGDT